MNHVNECGISRMLLIESVLQLDSTKQVSKTISNVCDHEW